MTADVGQRKHDQAVINFGLRTSIMRNAASENLVGEGFPPGARSATNGGKGEGDLVFDAAFAAYPSPRSPCERVLSHKGRAGSLSRAPDRLNNRPC